MLIQEEEYFEMLIKVYYLYILNIANYAVVQNIYLFIYLSIKLCQKTATKISANQQKYNWTNINK